MNVAASGLNLSSFAWMVSNLFVPLSFFFYKTCAAPSHFCASQSCNKKRSGLEIFFFQTIPAQVNRLATILIWPGPACLPLNRQPSAGELLREPRLSPLISRLSPRTHTQKLGRCEGLGQKKQTDFGHRSINQPIKWSIFTNVNLAAIGFCCWEFSVPPTHNFCSGNQ